MPKQFRLYDYLLWKDMERCPYVIWSVAANDWEKDWKARMLLNALDRYALDIVGKEWRTNGHIKSIPA